MTNPAIDDNEPILVEFAIQPGEEETSLSLSSGTELARKSAEALEKAMGTIGKMAKKTIETMDRLANKPTQVEIEFGIKLDVEAGALISKAGGEGNFKVKLVWDRTKETGSQSSS